MRLVVGPRRDGTVRVWDVARVLMSVFLLAATVSDHVSVAASGGHAMVGAGNPITVRPAGGRDGIGSSVAVSKDMVVVGAPFRAINGHGTRGEVLVFVKPKGGWRHATPTATLTASDGSMRSVLGTSVGISGRTIVASEPYRQVGGHAGQGAIYVFAEPKRGWHSETQTAELHAADGGAHDLLGSRGSLGIWGNTIVAGAPGHADGRGAVYVFTKSSAGWRSATQSAELTSRSALRGQAFGAAVSVSGDTIAVGAPGPTRHGGAVYVFQRPTGGWRNATPDAVLRARRNASDNELGNAVAVSRSTLVAAAREHHRIANNDRNVLYVFAKPLGGWRDASQTAVLNETNSREGDGLGRSLAIGANTILAGDPSHKLTANYSPGAAYLFERPAGGWRNATETSMLTPRVSADNERFAFAVAMSGSTLVFGAPGYGHARDGGAQGAVYITARPQHQAGARPDPARRHRRRARQSACDLGNRLADRSATARFAAARRRATDRVTPLECNRSVPSW
jgi:hypothetical protein